MILEAEEGLNLYFTSCSADGSVDRIVKKLVRSMKEKEGEVNPKRQNIIMPSTFTPYVKTRLLHEVDTIFSNGRKFGKLLCENHCCGGIWMLVSRRFKRN
jgi:hypothetical protein